MNRRTFLKTAGAVPPALSAEPPARKPNVIWIFGDQHRAQAMGCAGDPNAHTPHLDTMAAQGVRFTAAVSGMPLCCPFRGSLVTGRYPHHCVPGHEYPLPEGQQTIAHVFRGAGYHTGYFGKWHLAGIHESEGRSALRPVPPAKRGGFDTWVGYDNNNSQYDCWVQGGAGKDAFHYRLPGYETDELTNLFIKYIREQAAAKRPFFAALSVQPPHNPYVAPPEFMGRHTPARIELRPNVPRIAPVVETARRDLAGYYAQIENLDWNVGRVRKVLEEAGIAMNTHILFFSDHGDMHGSHGQYKKMTAYQESIGIPFLIGGGQPHGYEGWGAGAFRVPLNHVDISATTLGLCGIEKPEWMEGTDYSHYRLRGRKRGGEPDSAFLQSVVPTMHGDSVDKPWRGIVTRDGWKYCCFEGVSWVMFNLNEDPYELVNVAHNSKYRAERRRLVSRLREWIAGSGDKFNVPEA
ncbi:MAG: sulfatase [Bryobacteraceae bacterium]